MTLIAAAPSVAAHRIQRMSPFACLPSTPCYGTARKQKGAAGHHAGKPSMAGKAQACATESRQPGDPGSVPPLPGSCPGAGRRHSQSRGGRQRRRSTAPGAGTRDSATANRGAEGKGAEPSPHATRSVELARAHHAIPLREPAGVASNRPTARQSCAGTPGRHRLLGEVGPGGRVTAQPPISRS